MIWIAAVVVILLLLWLFLIFPSRASGTARAPFENRAYAHRGLYTADQSVPENSLPAFHRAVEAGYGAELDVQLTRDGYIVVLHDDDLKRACGVEDSVCDHTLAELRAMKLFGTEEEIPLFADVLRIFDGKQPLIVELKYGPNWKELCAAVKEMLAEYRGPACVESFHPSIVRWFRKNDPERIRGQLAMPAGHYHGADFRAIAWALSRVLFNCAARPNFIAYQVGPKPLTVRLCEKLGAMKVCWTARDPARHQRLMAENDAVIFEHYRP